MHTLTNEEVQALDAILDDAIVKSKEDDNGDPVFHEVRVHDVNPFADKRTQDGVYDCLARKGMIECSGTADTNGREILEFVCITPQGFEALKSARGVN